ncbi:hypothetical protein WISP_10981 [Willisornis vidua]|uniref:IL26 protein n=1 Tax=Willisornis vidua TaxID=1566151 RepID=A0ABQ9DRZ8_9PASS|nr:hypothetical protein WISP_10981 [Willisornis vidua]
MLCLLGVVLSCAGLCLVSPMALPTPTACPGIGLFKEAMCNLQALHSKTSSEEMPLNNMTKVGGNVTILLQGFIDTLKSSKESAEQKRLIGNLQQIQTHEQSCTGWMAALKEHRWNAAKEYDFFDNLEYIIRFLSHNGLPKDIVSKIFVKKSSFATLPYMFVSIPVMLQEKYFTPLHIQRLSCAHNNTEIFIHELEKIPVWKCVKKVQQGMKRLEKTCYILKKSPSKDQKCLEKAKKRFSRFKESLKEFLRWINQNLDCSSAGRSESGLYLDGKCNCGENPWKSQQGLG